MARRWWFVLLLVPLLTGGTTYVVVSRQQPLYAATATLQVNPPQNETATYSTLLGTMSLAETYKLLITTRPVLGQAATSLGYREDALGGAVSASTVRETQIIRVSASDPDPVVAAQIANAVARAFVEYSVQQAMQLSSPYRATLEQQINDVSTQIDNLREQIQTVEQDPAKTNDPPARAQVDTQRAQLTELERSYRDLLVTVNEMDLAAASARSQVSVAEEAEPPRVPYAPRTKVFTAVGLLAGLMLAIGVVALVEYLDNTVKSTADFQGLVGAPLLSVIGLAPKVRGGHDQLFLLEQPTTQLSEAVRLLRTNLEFAAAAGEISSLVVTSAGPSEGKSTVAANLAVAPGTGRNIGRAHRWRPSASDATPNLQRLQRVRTVDAPQPG